MTRMTFPQLLHPFARLDIRTVWARGLHCFQRAYCVNIIFNPKSSAFGCICLINLVLLVFKREKFWFASIADGQYVSVYLPVEWEGIKDTVNRLRVNVAER